MNFPGLQIPTSRSELGGPSGKLSRFVSCVRARGAMLQTYVRSDLSENACFATFPFPFSGGQVYPFAFALHGPIRLQLALSVLRLDISGIMLQVHTASQCEF